MKKNKNILYILALCLFSYLQVKTSEGTDIINLYSGVIFNPKFVYYINCFFLYACYCLYIYNEFEPYVTGYGICLITREKSRKQFAMHLVKRLLGFFVSFETMKILCYLLVTQIVKGQITLSNPLELIQMIILNMLCYVIILFFQMIMELYFSGNFAMWISLIYFSICIGISDFIHTADFLTDKLNLLFIPNLMFKNRLNVLLQNDNHVYFLIMLLICIAVCIYIVFTKMLKRKDIL